MNWPYELGASASTLQAAFDHIVVRFQRPLAQYLFRFVFRQDAALDLTQETFVKAFQNLHRYDSARPFSTWLFSIASNLAKDHLRKTSRFTEVPLGESDEAQMDFRQPDRQLETMELGHAIEEAIAALPLLYREPLLLRHIAGFSVSEIAEALAVTEAVVKVRLFRARNQMQEMLGKEWLAQ